jgi:tryptophanyl-tRNA synthetase
MRARYDALMAEPEKIEAILQAGAVKARAIARPLLDDLRHAVGLRRFQPLVSAQAATPQAKVQLPAFKQYRESDGRFYFKLAAHDGRVLLQSQGFEGGREAGEWVKKLRTGGAAALSGVPAALGAGIATGDVEAALEALRAAAEV